MSAQLPSIIPAPLLFPTSGPVFNSIGYFPNQPAANPGILPSLLGIAGGPGNIPVLNDYNPVMPALVTQIMGGGAPSLGSQFRPFPFGSLTPNAGAGIITPQSTIPTSSFNGLIGQQTAPSAGTNSFQGSGLFPQGPTFLA